MNAGTRSDFTAFRFFTAMVMIVWAFAFGDASLVHAETQLRLDAGLQTLAPGEAGFVSVILDDAVMLRTIEVTLRGDPDRLLDMTSTPGMVFDDVACMIWDQSEITEPGVWHGFAVIIGSECAATGPGELLRWTFTAGADGGTIIDPVEVKLYAPDATRIDDVTCDHAVVLISTTTDVPSAGVSSRLQLHPNPFNPLVNLTVDLNNDACASLSVYDARGRLVATPWRGTMTAGRSVHQWRGVGDGGLLQPSGTYLFVLDVQGREPVTMTGSLVR
jgi:hypothetical protein